MEREIKLLRQKIQELSAENAALREINVQFQLENFKLQQKIKTFEGDVIAFDNTESEYLDDDHLNLKPKSSSRTTKRSYQAAFEDVDEEESFIIKQEIVVEQEKMNDDRIPEPQSEDDIDEDLTPKESASIIFKLAAKKGQLEKLKMLDPGKQKDASFVNKCLDMFFDRQHLANSSARGQKCPKQPDTPVRPALDQKKLNICRQAFIYRLSRESLTNSAKQERLKNFFAYVNFKIQNSRKLLSKQKEKADATLV